MVFGLPNNGAVALRHAVVIVVVAVGVLVGAQHDAAFHSAAREPTRAAGRHGGLPAVAVKADTRWYRKATCLEATMPGTCFFAQRRVRSLNKVLCEKAELAV